MSFNICRHARQLGNAHRDKERLVAREQRLAISNRYGWQRFLHMVDQVMPRRGDTLQLPLEVMEDKDEAAN
jgi:hypothetical protein